MSKTTDEFQIFVKPVGPVCNLDCSYCYYSDKQHKDEKNELSVMSADLLERYIIQHLETSAEETIMFSWHGGEPTLAGIDFYKKAIGFQKKHNNSAKRILNGIQTNATNLNKEWCKFLSENNFFVGISLDGTEELHNMNRKTKFGTGTFKNVIEGYMLLKEYNIDHEILCVVNKYNVKQPFEVYNFFKSLGTNFITFLPLVERSYDSKGSVSENSVNADEFGHFLITVFDEWQENDIGKIKIQIFEETLRTAFNQDHSLCILKKTCGRVPVLEKDGQFYSCDHYVNDDHLIGNIKKSHLSDLLNKPKQKEFGDLKFNTLPKYCLDCEVLFMCNGGCPKNRFIETPTEESGLNYLCKGYKAFFKHCIPVINAIVELSEN